MSVQTLLQHVDAVEAREGGREGERAEWFALVDHAGCPELLRHLDRGPGVPWISLFEGSREASALAAAPILVSLGETLGRGRPLLTWLASQCQTSNALLVLRSRRQHRELARALTRRLDARLPDDVAAMLRYFDTRTLVSLLDALSESQQEQFLGVAHDWSWLDRSGAPVTMQAQESAIDLWVSPFEVSEEQQAAMVDAAEPDAICQFVRTHMPDVCAPCSYAQLHAHVLTTLPRAKQHGIESPRDLALFCAVALLEGSSFDADIRWADMLERMETERRDFLWAVSEMGGNA